MSKVFSVEKFLNDVNSEEFASIISILYGSNAKAIEFQRNRYIRLYELFTNLYPEHKEFRIFSAPGRTEIAGNHTDHQGGHVLCASVDMDVIAFVAPRPDNVIRIKSEHHSNFDILTTDVSSPEESEYGTSLALIKGVVAGFNNRGLNTGGFDAYTTSNVPKGSGLSSSAAFEILVSSVLNTVYNESKATYEELAIISQYSENAYFGKPCGLMDQCGCAFGGIMTIDFAKAGDPKVSSLKIDLSSLGYSLVITDTRGSHAGLTGDYASIPADMRAVAKALGCAILSESSSKALMDNITEIIKITGTGPVLRAMHFYADDERVTLQANALRKGDIQEFLKLVTESGISSWTMLRNVYTDNHPDHQELSLALAVSNSILGREGACRVHGGGFAGTIQAFVPLDKSSYYVSEMNKIFGDGAASEIRIRNLPAGEIFSLVH